MVGQNLIRLQEVDSTNNYARGLLQSKEAVEGTAVLAYSQQNGRGQDNNLWESQPGKNLTVSFILEPIFLPPDKQFYLSMAAALSAADFFNSQTSDVSIKWPNDIYWKNKKAGGILIENSLLGNTFEFSIIGFGLNINQEKFYSGAPNPVSLKQITGIGYDIDLCCSLLADRLNFWYDLLKKGKSSEIRASYLKLLYLKDTLAKFRSKDFDFSGQIFDVGESGQLVVKKEDGTIHLFCNKEIEFLL